MEEDIKILEELEEFMKEELRAEHSIFSIEQLQAIENLIARYKELEKYKRIAELTKISCCIAQNCEALNNAIRASIENVKLKEGIENIIKNELPDDDICNCCSIYDVNGIDLKIKLQSLLED